MTHHIRSVPSGDEPEHRDVVADTIGALAPMIALLAAWVATAGSLFLSDVLGWVPCTLCWYQRILMYPLSIIMLVGLLRRERNLYQYVLPFSLAGAGVAGYHYALQKTDWFPPPPCTSGVPCTVDYINLFGFVTVPFLALTAFLIVTAAMLVTMLSAPEPVDAPQPRRWLGGDRIAALGIVALVLVAYRIAAAYAYS